ncbi:MAG: hypothetical protein ACXIVD_15675 [Salinarimonas sp.]
MFISDDKGKAAQGRLIADIAMMALKVNEIRNPKKRFFRSP